MPDDVFAPPAYRHGATARRVLVSLVPVICPPEAAALADAIVDHMALTMGVLPPLFRGGLVAGLHAYDLGALAFPPARGRRAHRLSAEVAERYYASWEHGPTPVHVQFARGINQLMSLACYEQPAMAEALGYRPGPWMEQVTRRRLEVYRDDIARHDAALLAPDPLRPGFHASQLRKARG